MLLCYLLQALTSLLSWERGLKYKGNARAVQRYVAPLVGAWIEIFCTLQHVVCSYVAPLVGAWIEIILAVGCSKCAIVAPLVGAWIEISCYLMLC